MKEKYEDIVSEIIIFNTEDVISLSTDLRDDTN